MAPVRQFKWIGPLFAWVGRERGLFIWPWCGVSGFWSQIDNLDDFGMEYRHKEGRFQDFCRKSSAIDRTEETLEEGGLGSIAFVSH